MNNRAEIMTQRIEKQSVDPKVRSLKRSTKLTNH